jgi:rhodanese-related sulfurtransferase
MIPQLNVSELKQWLDENRTDFVLLDVREPWEAEVCTLPDAVLMPMGQIPNRVAEVDTEQKVVVFCHHGIRSQQVAYFLQHAGLENVYNLRGGIDAWAKEIDQQMATY